MYYKYIRVNASVVDGFDERVTYHTVNTILGIICTAINVVLLAIFLIYRPFRTRYVVSNVAHLCFVVPFLSGMFVTVSVVFALFTAIYYSHPTHYHCGRKATFGEGFSTFLYISNIFCNVFATMLNAAAYVKARTMTKNV
ncbi:hypothetical protein ANCDUO_22690 [Ancylostoma duodenale]|uniref:Uncharacterized protein n=1 Tax=Ancylostoma duodenale TaxID=51022 RepID=A0A0C2BTL2_9BILA|nr:hypothetical protein ANCDUO_22690 [Ancylostoma duodenale]